MKNNNTPNCYECKHRAKIIGDAHSQCKHPLSLLTASKMYCGLNLDKRGVSPLVIVGNSRGIKHGWFCWPFNFDPTWLEECSGFESITGKEVTPNESNNLQ